MPELPEVETIRADLQRHIVGQRFTGAELLWHGSIGRPGPEAFVSAIAGRQIEHVGRRGKYLLLRLNGDASLVAHLRMTGRLCWRSPGAPRERHLRALLFLDEGHELHFEDQRKFGRLYLVPDTAALDEVLAKVGPEPLSASFTLDALRALLQGRKTLLKPLLLDQRFVAGLGNIYVDEALFLAGLHPLCRTDRLAPADTGRLYQGIVAALRQGIEKRGTTFSAYRDASGASGSNQEALLVFRRQGRPCSRCGTRIAKIRVGGRGTHFCPHCQPPE